MSLTRLDCGTPQAPTAVNQRFSDTYAYGDLKLQFVFSCYLIKHGDEYLLWDTGHSMTAPNVAPKVSIVDQLAKLDVKPEQIKYVGISHYHADHTGQVASFPKATLLIGAKDWDAITAPKPAEGVNYKPFESWIKGDSKVEPQPLDKDMFGDGSVIMLRTPGHTAGPSQPAGQAAADGRRHHHRRCGALPRELRLRRRARRSTTIAPRRSPRSSASRRSRPTSRPRSSSSTTRATSTSCRRSPPSRSNRSPKSNGKHERDGAALQWAALFI